MTLPELSGGLPELAHSRTMTIARELPALPSVELELVEDLTPEQPRGFLRLRRKRYRVVGDGARSEPFPYDSVERTALDAVVMIVHFEREGSRWIYLRSASRPPLADRDAPSFSWDRSPGIQLWELPAGLVETDEQSREGLRRTASREAEEELGFVVEPSKWRELGHGIYPCPSVIAERQYFFAVEVDPTTRNEPALDGSVLEAAGVVIAARLEDVLGWCRSGRLPDGKTELGLRRFQEHLEYGG